MPPRYSKLEIMKTLHDLYSHETRGRDQEDEEEWRDYGGMVFGLFLHDDLVIRRNIKPGDMLREYFGKYLGFDVISEHKTSFVHFHPSGVICEGHLYMRYGRQ